jgi:hypothetical protein
LGTRTHLLVREEFVMNRSVTENSPPLAEDEPPSAARQRWMSIVFLEAEEAEPVLEMIDATGPQIAIRHLSQWDFGGETRDAALVNGYVYDEIPQGHTDRVIHDDASMYALTYNHKFRYVSLLRVFTPVGRPLAHQAWHTSAARLPPASP